MTTRRRRRHRPESKLCESFGMRNAMLNAGKDEAAVLQALEVSEATYHRWQNRYG